MVLYQSCDAVDFASEARGVVFVARQGEMDRVGGVRNRRTFGIKSIYRVKVSGVLKSSNGSGVFAVDLDFLKAEDVWPVVPL